MGMRGSAAEEPKGFDLEITKRLLRYVVPHRRQITLSFLFMLVSVGGNLAGPYLIGKAVDDGVRTGRMDQIVLYVLLYMLVLSISNIGVRGMFHTMGEVGQSIITQLRNELFEHIMNLPLAFFATYETGRLISRVIGDVNVIREMVTFSLIGVFRDLLTLVGIVVVMYTINAQMATVSLVVIPIMLIIANMWRIYARKAYIRQRTAVADVNAELAESFNGVRVVQAFARRQFNYDRFTSSINQENLASGLRAALVAALFFPTIEMIAGVAVGVLVWLGGNLVLSASLTAGTLVTFVLYTEQFFFPIRMLAQRYNTFQSTMAAGDKIFTLLDQPLTITDAQGAQTLPEVQGDVRFEAVTFSYDAEVDVLKNTTLDVPAGSTVALVGHTGAGKSTIINLLLRFYEVSQGRVTIDGYDVKSVTQQSLRKQMGVVLQQTFLFSGTVMDNIRYGRLNASDDDVVAAATAVGAHEFIEGLENGYYTEIQEGGALLSVGQRQLLSFARALLADPRILILDEATSSVDTRTEKIVQDALAKLLQDRTAFVIAHRLSTITTADQIIVMDHGEIVERGTHQELLGHDGIYRKLYTMAYNQADPAFG